MDSKKTAEFVNAVWDDSIIPELSEYIKIPNKSPMFDPDWEAHGHMDKAVESSQTAIVHGKFPGEQNPQETCRAQSEPS